MDNKKIKVISPVDGSIFIERDFTTKNEIAVRFSQAQSAWKKWKNSAIEERAHYCRRMVDALVANKANIAYELCWQMGRPIRYGAGEIEGVQERALHMINIAAKSLAAQMLPAKPGFQRWITRESLGVVFIIAPWNYPYLTAINTIIPALMAGNVVMLKPSSQTPLCAERLAEACKIAGIPEGVFQYLYLSHTHTQQVIQEYAVDYVAFTGSERGGQQVQSILAGRFIDYGLELGGKDPAYVRADVNIDNAVETIIDGAYFNSGQSCCGVERIYVHEKQYEHFVSKAIEVVNRYQLDRPDKKVTTLGPVVRASSAKFVRNQIDEAIAMGADACINEADFPMSVPGSPYLAPQLLVNVNHKMRIMKEESFGPVVGIQKVTSDAEAIALMNDSQYGLTASIFTHDIQEGIALGRQIETGTFFLNRCDYLDPALAWTGVKKSGRGVTLSSLGYEGLTQAKSFHIKQDVCR